MSSVKNANRSHIRPLASGGVEVTFKVGADEIANLPRCVYDVTRDYLSGDITNAGRDSMAMIILVLSDLLPDDRTMIRAIEELK